MDCTSILSNSPRRVMENPFLDDYKFSVPLVVDVKARH